MHDKIDNMIGRWSVALPKIMPMRIGSSAYIIHFLDSFTQNENKKNKSPAWLCGKEEKKHGFIETFKQRKPC